MDLTGSLLIAMPDLHDPNFHRAVVLILESDEEGALGLILNRGSALSAQELCINQGVIWRGVDGPVCVGGPVEPASVWVLHDQGEEVPDSCMILGDCSLTTTLEGLRTIADAQNAQRVIYAGYAGWGSEQLAGEIREGAWLTTPASPELIFMAERELMWAAAMRSVGVDPGTLVCSSQLLQ